MRQIRSVSLDAAGELINFKSGPDVSTVMAKGQLEGAVAIHNLLAQQAYAYLADEVGMGKTYIALGAVSLLRFFNPGFRVLYIAPRENIQRKWIKELRNFVSHNWRNVDQRVKSVQGTPARGIVLCHSLLDWTRKSVRDPSRDFYCRLTSFSFPLPDDPREWRKKRDDLAHITPLKFRYLLNFKHRDKARFKHDYARTLNILHPHYDLVVFDEGHNLKHGRSSSAARNQLIQLVLGTADDEESASWPDYKPRFDRLLLLSATPLETDYIQLWNQLDVFGFGDQVAALRDSQLSESEQQAATKQFLIRRLTGLNIGGSLHTKNMYRREWRAGGCAIHDDPMEVPNERQRLIVALVQKKVAEVLRDERFGNRFQIGMLASFESFLETANVATGDDEDQATFEEGAEQTDEQLERDGIDTPAVNELASDYRRRFGRPLPHPKMDSVVETLAESFQTGEKALVFVRRIKSVEEIARKLAVAYDRQIFRYLKEKLRAELRPDFDQLVEKYKREQTKRDFEAVEPEDLVAEPDFEADEELLAETGEAEDEGGSETFFSWFFRGDGPRGWLSGAAFRKNRLRGEGSLYSTMFEDNYVADLLKTSTDVLGDLSKLLGREPVDLEGDLRKLAYSRLQERTRKKLPRLRIFHAYQEAALELLAGSGLSVHQDARTIRQKRYGGKPLRLVENVPAELPGPAEFLDTKTFFTEIRHRPALAETLWPPSRQSGFPDRFLDRERRRELLAAAARLGHAYIDLWVLAVNTFGSLSLGRQIGGEEKASSLITDYLDLLQSQAKDEGTFTAFKELQLVARHHDLIHAVNFPEALRAEIPTLPRLYATSLGKQTPVGRIHGGARSDVLVRQFRMPGYPFALVSTDVLREGEDLHTFCARVIHYGLAWTPSATEQRTGRVDRIGSLIHRHLDNRSDSAEPEDFLQVYYPFLGDTVERLQAARVFERMNRFVRLIHGGFRAEKFEASINTQEEFARLIRDIAPIKERLKTLFPIEKELLEGEQRLARGPIERVEELMVWFQFLKEKVDKRLYIEWDVADGPAARYGTAFLLDGDFVKSHEELPPNPELYRRQPFALFMRKSAHDDVTLLHAISPVGEISMDDDVAIEMLQMQSDVDGDKICVMPESSSESYTVTVEGDLLLDPELTQVDELEHLIRRICFCADFWEDRYFRGERDLSIEQFRRDLHREARLVAH